MFRGITKQLAEENTSMIDHMQRAEKDTIDVCAFLRKMNEEKDAEILSLQYELNNIRIQHDAEKKMIVSEFNERLGEVQENLDARIMQSTLIQTELDQLKDFRKKKIQMQRELEEVKLTKKNCVLLITVIYMLT